MNIRECILDNRNCKDIILEAKETSKVTYFKKDGKELFDIDRLLDKRVYTSTRVGSDKITIVYFTNYTKWSDSNE